MNSSLSVQGLTLTRQGTIKVRVGGDSHCGHPSAMVDDTVPVKYTVTIDVSPDSHDGRGFIIDQERLHQLMTEFGLFDVWHESCEMLTVNWGYKLARAIKADNRHCVIRKLSLTLSPAPHLGALTSHFSSET